MADANLLEILDMENRLDNMIVYGNIRCAIAKPNFLSSKVKLLDGFFALVDVLALRCNGDDYFSRYSNYQDSKHIYFSKGSIVVVINDKNLIGKNVRVYGRSLKGCTIKKQMTKSIKDGVVAFVWTKGNDGNWCLSPNKVQPFGVSDAKGTVLEDYITCLVNGKDFTFSYPESLDSIQEYEGVSDAEELEFEEIQGTFDYTTESVDLSEIPLNLVHRLEAKEVSDNSEAVGEAVLSLMSSVREYSKGLISDTLYEAHKEYSIDEEDRGSNEKTRDAAERIVNSFLDNVAFRYNLNLHPSVKVKGKDVVDALLDKLSGRKFIKDGNDEDELSGVELYKEIENIRKTVGLDHNVIRPEVSKIPMLKDYLTYASMIIGVSTGVGIDNMLSNYTTMHSYSEFELDEWFWCIMRNPYLCGLMGSNFNLHDCDRIFLGFSEPDNYAECMKFRNMFRALENIKNASGRSTLISRREVLKSYNAYPAMGNRYIGSNGTIFKKENALVVELCGGRKANIEDTKKLIGTYINMSEVLKELNGIGLIEEVNDGIILSSDMKKEHDIYRKLIEKGRDETGITEDEVNDTIEKFEDDRGFNLEVLQKDGIQLVRHCAGVLSGCAGSGKTTTSDCMVMAIEDYLPEYKLRFGAPTGKAARRLAEVVGGNVKTIHSMFGLGLSGEPYISKYGKYRKKNDEGVKYAYFLDEMAMCNTDLMYAIVSNLNDDDLVYFLGDIKQLSPIGKGSPFRALMQFLPCVELGVSKRAAADGKINYNCGLINFASEDRVVELQEGEDFEIMPCADIEIQKKTVDTFKRYLSEFNEDDIQVVTGYQTNKYPWSTVNLNPLLQDLLRNESELLYVYNERKFMVNDRVIHISRNAYEMPRYRSKGNNVFEEVVTFGVVNGELGKIVGCVRSDKAIIQPWEDSYTDEEFEKLSEDERKLILKRRSASVEIVNNSEINDENTYFVMVQVYDVDLMEDIIVLYKAMYREKISNEYYTRTFSGGDLAYLDLAYALTTHKMQGSQSPAVIMPLGAEGSPQFMNRNMVNTMITRTQKKIALIGSVKGQNSALTNGRRITNINDGEDVLSLLV